MKKMLLPTRLNLEEGSESFLRKEGPKKKVFVRRTFNLEAIKNSSPTGHPIVSKAIIREGGIGGDTETYDIEADVACRILGYDQAVPNGRHETEVVFRSK